MNSTLYCGATLVGRLGWAGRASRAAVVLMVASGAFGFQKPHQPELPNFDRRERTGAIEREGHVEHLAAQGRLRNALPDVKVQLDAVTGTPRWIAARNGFLTGRGGRGRGVTEANAAAFDPQDPDRAAKSFLREHRGLFGHGAEVLTGAKVKRQFTGARSRLRSVVWQQQLDGIDVFEGVLIAHTTQNDELVNLSSQFIPDAAAAANRGNPNRAGGLPPKISARRAVSIAAQQASESTGEYEVAAVDEPAGTEQRQQFKGPGLNGPATLRLVWLPMNRSTIRLCWEVILTSRSRGEMFRVLVDAQSGEAHLRHCLTEHLSNVTYRVYTSDSPSPFSPGHLNPSTNQPPLVERSLITLDALNTNASPAGWINDGDNETRGNNVDAHIDRNNDDSPDLPRPQGSPFRVFDFPLNLNGAPSSYTNASVTQLFYWNNWMHDRLYALGFTEEAGNFQNNNFGRGGFGNDAVEADAQDGGGFNNANMSTPPDGNPPRMQMYLFDGPSPDRDGDFDAEIVLHEYTHGLSNRRVGGGVGLQELQSRGMGEGWSDFYGLALLGEAGDDLDGNFAAGGYLTYQFFGLTQNYYFGIRRYPYSTDLTKNPLTFKDIDPNQASNHAGIPMNPIFGGASDASEVHNQGEVWCVVLWEVRVNLIREHGFSVGNELALQLVTDGMNLSPANPNFLEARDAILQADVVLTGGANQNAIWRGFAKRGMGLSATSPQSMTTLGILEAFDVPDDLVVTPLSDFAMRGQTGGPFAPTAEVFTVSNVGTSTIPWSVSVNVSWLTLSNMAGNVTPEGASSTVVASLNNSAYFLEAGIHSGAVVFSNHLSGVTHSRRVFLNIGQPEFLTEWFNQNDLDLRNVTLTFTPDGSPGFYSVCRESASEFPVSTLRGKEIYPGDDNYEAISLAGPARVSLFGRSTNEFYIGSNGYITFGDGDFSSAATPASHFARRRISALFAPLDMSEARLSWQQLTDRAAVTYQNVLQRGQTNRGSFQIEMFYDGRIRLTYLAVTIRNGLVGLSRGTGVPSGFSESDLSNASSCGPRIRVSLPPEVTEGQGTLIGTGMVGLTAPTPVEIVVTLGSSNPNQLSVPSGVVIPAGQSNALFNLVVIDDNGLDGSQGVVITADSAGFAGGVSSVVVHDNEQGVLNVILPPAISENAVQVQGTVSLPAPATTAADVVVTLLSSAPLSLATPSFVVIPAGASSVGFSATVTNNTLINQPRSVQVTASVSNWNSGTATVTVHDDESLDIVVLLPAEAYEVNGVLSGAGSVRISGTLTSNLTVHLVSQDTSELVVPSNVTIPAGQTIAAFDLTLIDDLVLDSNQTVSVVASAPGFNSGTNHLVVLDDEFPPLPGKPVPADFSTDVPLNVVLGWSGGQGELAVNGDFETGDFTGWGSFDVGNGLWQINDGTMDPSSPDGPLAPYRGQFSAIVNQAGGGQHILYQDITIPTGSRVRLSWAHRIRNHAAVFTDGQGFRVEVRDTNDVVRAIAFSTRPGDPLLQEWEQRTYDLTSFAGQTVRLAFVEGDELYYFNAHLDDVSVLSSSTSPALFDVRFGTSEVLGPTNLAGTTVSNTWVLPQLAPLTTYYWQIVSRRATALEGPVWRFTTRGVDHFTFSSIASPQHDTIPFTATVVAKDDTGGTVSNFTGTVDLELVSSDQTSFTILDSPELQQSNSGNLTLGYAFTPTTDLLVSHFRSFGGTKVALWTVDGELLASQTVLAEAGTWSEHPIPSPLRLTAGQTYMLSFYAPAFYFYAYGMGLSFAHGSLEQAYQGLGDGFPSQATNFRWPYVDLRYRVELDHETTISPPVSGNFVNGTWTGVLTPSGTGKNLQVYAQDANGKRGWSNPFELRNAPGVLDHFSWGPIASTQTWATPFSVTLTARDSFSNLVSQFNQPVALSARPEAAVISIGQGSARSIYPLATFFEDGRSQVIYLTNELGGKREFGSLAIHVALPPGQSIQVWTIRMRHTALSEYGLAPRWEFEDWTAVFEGGAVITSPGWVTFPFTHSFTYDGLRNVMIDFTFDNNSFSYDGECFVTTTDSSRSINFSTDGQWGDPLFWLGELPEPEVRREIPNIRLGALAADVEVTPSVAASFTNGVWSGNLQVNEFAPAVRLHADDGMGHSGTSESFSLQLLNDLAVSVTPSARPGIVGDPFRYTVRVTNSGPATALGVRLTNYLTGDFPNLSVTTSQGACNVTSGQVRCTLGSLGPGATAVIQVSFTPDSNGFIQIDSVAAKDGAEAYLLNNQAGEFEDVLTRSLFARETHVWEGDQGTTNALFAVRLSHPSSVPISVTFETTPGAALAGSDFRATNGSLVFSPGQVEKVLAVSIVGDRRFESIEEFSLDFQGPPNAVLDISPGICFIENDDPQPSIAIGDGSVLEGNTGFRLCAVPLLLSEPSGIETRVFYFTAPISAVAPADYITTNGVVVIPEGQTNGTINVVIRGDTDVEFDESFLVNLSSVEGAFVTDFQGEARIISDDLQIVIVPAEATLVSEANTNNAADPGETVTMSFGLLNVGNLNTTNLVATLRATNGVSNPSGPQTYGVILFGSNMVSRPFSFTAQGTNGGTVRAILDLSDGGVNLGTATFDIFLGPVAAFRIAGLDATGFFGIEHNGVTGDDRGGIAISSSQVFYTGDGGTARFSASSLAGGANLGRTFDVMVSDLRTEKVYALGNGGVPINGSGSTVNSLLEINGENGTLTGSAIPLSTSIVMNNSSGIFAGYGRVVLYSGGRVYAIALPSGTVTDLGGMAMPQFSMCEHWAFWGVAESFSNATWLVYVRFSDIVRTRVPDGTTSVVSSFANLADMCSFTVSLSRRRWYFHHEGTSQFRSGDETLGYCDARFVLSSGSTLDHLEWSPIPLVRQVATPIPVTITARDALGGVMKDFAGTVDVSASAVGVIGPRTLLNTPVHSVSGIGNFTVGYSFTPSNQLTLTHVRHYSGSKVSIWTDAGVLLASTSISGTPGTWSETPLSSPLNLAAGTRYRVGFFTGGAGYFWRNDLPPVFTDGSIDQAYSGTGDVFPNSVNAVRWWFVDLRYTSTVTASLPVAPSVSGTFSDGAWTGTVTIGALGSNVVLRAREANGRIWPSNPFKVVASGSGLLDRFGWSLIPSPQTSSVPFVATIRALDEVDNVVSNYAGPVTLSGSGTRSRSFALRDTEASSQALPSGNFTLGYAFTPTNDIVVTHLSHYSGTKVSIWNADHVLLASQAISNSPGVWKETPLAVPLPLVANTTYTIGFRTGTQPYYWSDDETTGFAHGHFEGSLYALGDAEPANPFAGGWWLVGLRYTADGTAPVVFLSADVVELVNGAWTGPLAILDSGRIVLRSTNSQGKSGESNPFDLNELLPRLAIERQGGLAILSWSTSGPDFLLEAAPNLTSVSNWVSVSNTPAFSGGTYWVTNSIGGQHQYYRLRRQ